MVTQGMRCLWQGLYKLDVAITIYLIYHSEVGVDMGYEDPADHPRPPLVDTCIMGMYVYVGKNLPANDFLMTRNFLVDTIHHA